MADSLAEVEVETVGNTLAEEGAKALLDTLASKKPLTRLEYKVRADTLADRQVEVEVEIFYHLITHWPKLRRGAGQHTD